MAAPITGPLTAPAFVGDVYQCEPVTVSWSGGSYPIRVEAFYQTNTTSTWRNTGIMPAEAASTESIEWIANVPAGSIAWITLVDHDGQYKQTTQGSVVKDSSNSSCLQPDKSASVVTATVYMTDGHVARSPVNDKALLISAVLFGILFFACLGGVLYLYSLLRRARRVRNDRARFIMADDDEHSIHGERTFAAAAAASNNDPRSRKQSEMSDAGTLVQGPAAVFNRDDKNLARRTSVMSERDPFLDPPNSANSLTSFPCSAMQENQMSRGSTSVTRPTFAHAISEADTLSSATSMQLFGTRGGLRVMNDPAEISTPNLSRADTRASDYSAYPASTGTNSSDAAVQRSHSTASNAGQMQASASGHSEISQTPSVATSTENHYSSEPHSSKIYLARQQSAKGE